MPSSERTSLQDEQQSQPDPVEDGVKAVGDVADRVGDPGRDEDVKAVVGGRVCAFGAYRRFAGQAGRPRADLGQLIADRVAYARAPRAGRPGRWRRVPGRGCRCRAGWARSAGSEGFACFSGRFFTAPAIVLVGRAAVGSGRARVLAGRPAPGGASMTDARSPSRAKEPRARAKLARMSTREQLHREVDALAAPRCRERGSWSCPSRETQDDGRGTRGWKASRTALHSPTG